MVVTATGKLTHEGGEAANWRYQCVHMTFTSSDTEKFHVEWPSAGDCLVLAGVLTLSNLLIWTS